MKKTVILNLLILLFNYSIGQGRQLQNSSINSRIISLMNARNVPGCVISVVSDILVLYQGAFGFSDLEKRERVSLNDTRFFVGSVSKLITATEVLKAIEQGYLDENADIGEYAPDLHFWRTFSNRVTIKNLLSHTSGLNLTSIGKEGISAGRIS